MGFPRARRRLLATLGLLLLGPVCLSGYEYHPYNYGYEYYETYDLYDDYGNPTSDNGDYAPDGGEPAVSGQAPLEATTLEVVRRRGYVMVGTYDDVPGFSEEVLGPQGGPSVWQGFDVDLGRAVAAAVLGDPTAVQFFRVTTVDRFPKLRVRGVDMVAAAASWTSGRDASREEGLRFLGPSWYDVQAYVTATATGITSIQGFAGKYLAGKLNTTSLATLRANVEAAVAAGAPDVTLRFADTNEGLLEQFLRRWVHGITGDRAPLVASLCQLRPGVEAHIVLEDSAAREVVGPVVRDSDPEWGDIVHWTLMGLITAEELGITAANAKSMRDRSDDPAVRYLLGADGDIGSAFGLSAEWMLNVILGVGNYGELYARNLARYEECGMKRGLNQLARDGGILTAPVFSPS
mmetsp:Transcript_17442/g.44646  ORF Transcript_17442/g.44646 Transcript_17442/m.44646 type:complete len:406 (-) Transcript_17442:414-1631(-)|eukprot:jgi/Tetstr1/445665/TSEL_003470.t1